MRKHKKKFRNTIGTIVPAVVILISAIIPLLGLSVDIGYFGIVRTNLEKATEAAAVSGAQEYFRGKADAGKAINTSARVFKMNISSDTMIGNYHPSTGQGRPTTLSYSHTFTESDGISSLFRGSPVSFTVTTDLNRGKISVMSEVTPKPLFAYFLPANTKISITKEAELPPYDVVFVVDLSGSMRYATVNTYIGTANVQMQGVPGAGPLLTDVVLFQSQSQRYSRGSTITANGLVTRIVSITDIVINSPGYDIPNNATYSTSKPIYILNQDRGYIVNTDRSTSLVRTALTGFRISQLGNLNISAEDQRLAQTYSNNRSLNPNDVSNYFNRAASYIEPTASSAYGVMAFIDTVKIYGTAALKLSLVTFSSNSYLNDRASTYSSSELLGTSIPKSLRNTFPYISLVNPSDFNTIVDRLTIMSQGGNGSLISPISTYSYPDGGTNINAGLDNAKTTLDRSDRPSSEKIIILFTDGAPSHSFAALGSKVKSLTDAGIKIYSIVLTLAISQSTIDQFKYQVETVGKAEPVVFINEPAKLKDAFTQIADELGLKLVR